MSIIQAAGSGEVSTGFYSHLLDQSIKFNDDDTQSLSRNFASSGNRRTWTWSAWIKRSGFGVDDMPLFNAYDSTSNYAYINFRYNSTPGYEVLEYFDSNSKYVSTTQVFRDASAFFNLVVTFDTTQSTEADRIKFYVNGSQITSFSRTAYPSQNDEGPVNQNIGHFLAKWSIGPKYFDGYIAEVNFIDGTALTPASFGETKNGIWIPKDTSGLTFGTNGFHLTFKDDVVSEGFNTVAYSGRSLTQSISGVGFSPGLVWTKRRSATSSHYLSDVVRGGHKILLSEGNSAEYDGTSNNDGVESFDSDGFTMQAGTYLNDYNASGSTYVAWCWEAGGTPTADNSAGAGATPTAGSVKIDGSNLGSALAGSIAATRLSANTARGFSIGTFTKGSGNETVAHGLGAAPDWLIVKRLNGTGSWYVYHSSNGSDPETDYITLNSNSATADESTVFGDTAPTSTVFTVGAAFNSSEELVFYAWTEISGYSKFGSFTGNGGSQAIDVGFAPAWVMLRRTNGGSWGIFDNTRQSRNLQMLTANSNAAETTNAQMTFSGNTFNDNGYLSDNGATVLYMAFADTREAAFFKDVTSNSNHFTTANLDYRDSVPDVPTNNFNILNALHKRLDGTVTISEGNLQISAGGSYGGDNRFAGTTAVSSGKWYFEMLRTDSTGIGNQTATGVFDADTDLSSGQYSGNPTGSGAATNEWALTDRGYACNGSTYTNLSGTIGTVTQGKIVQVAVDMDNKKIWFGIDNTFSGDPAAGSGEAFSNLPTTILTMSYTAQSTQVFNFGQDSSFAGNKSTANTNADGNGRGSFQYAPPSGYLALCSQNLSDPAITDGTENFNTVLYAGNGGSSNAISGVGFSPDWLWIKNRTDTYSHMIYDTVRGAGKYISSDNTGAEATGSHMNSFDSDGFTVSAASSNRTNASSNNYVAWNWLAGTAFSNDASATGVGSIDSSGQVNTTAGFSIVSYEGSGSNATIAHGLSSAPEMLIVKNRENASGLWLVYHAGIASDAETDYVHLESTNAAADDNSAWNDTAPTSSVFSVGTSVASNQSGNDHIAYCFHSVEGYSKVGSYTGNGNSDGPFINTGFRPAWIMIKNITDAGEHWEIWDSTRDTHNVLTKRLRASSSGAEVSSTFMDFVSNGVKHRNTSGGYNASGKTFIYLAFAEQPFKFSNAR